MRVPARGAMRMSRSFSRAPANRQKFRRWLKIVNRSNRRRFLALLLLPRPIGLHRDVVVDRHGEQRWRIDFEIGGLARNRAGDLLFVSLRGDLERHIFVATAEALVG